MTTINNSIAFLEDDYKIPTTISSYMRPAKIEKDVTLVMRILPSWKELNCIRYYEYFDTREEKDKPVRSLTPFESCPWIWLDNKWHLKVPYEAWSMKIYNLNDNVVQLFTITQLTIKKAIAKKLQNEKYKDPTTYDIEIEKEWEALKTEYSVSFEKDSTYTDELLKWKDRKIDWDKFLACEQDVFSDIIITKEEVTEVFNK